MRLIDADELVSDLLDQIPNAENVHILKDIIDMQKTAYDVEKVISKLRDDDDFYKTPLSYRITIGRAIEIVKSGLEIDDNVCKWKYDREIMDNAEFKISCNSKPLKRGIVPNNFSYHDFKFCPYCGRKIEVR